MGRTSAAEDVPGEGATKSWAADLHVVDGTAEYKPRYALSFSVQVCVLLCAAGGALERYTASVYLVS